MELSERYIQQLEKEGFASVYEWQDEPGTVYPEHEHEGKNTMMLTDGSAVAVVAGEEKVLSAGDRLDVPAGVKHSVTVGSDGWIVIVGEEIPED